MQFKHLREKAGKLLILGFKPGVGPAVLTDFILLYEKLGDASGLTGTMLDMSNSSQNNKRSQEFASPKVCSDRHMLAKLPTVLHMRMCMVPLEPLK